MEDSPSRKGRSREHSRARATAPALHAEGSVSPLPAGEWILLFHPMLLEQLETLIDAAEAEKARKEGVDGPNTKLLAHLLDLIFEKIPQNPAHSIFRQGSTLGRGLTHWFRAKTGNGRYRLFFRYDSTSKVIVYAWVNDQSSLRTHGRMTDAYAVFRRMVLDDNNPPNSWSELLASARDDSALTRAHKLTERRVRKHP